MRARGGDSTPNSGLLLLNARRSHVLADFRPGILEWLCLGAGVLLTIHYAWIMDDAYVYQRYADNLLFLGNGLVYNRGEFVEGFSSPLWMIALAIIRATHLDYWILVRIVGAICFVGFWILLITTNRNLSPRDVGSFNLPLLYLTFTYGTICYFTSGLETPIVQLIAVAFALLVVAPASAPARALVALAPLARPELTLPFAMILFWIWHRQKRFPWTLALSGIGLAAAWLLFRIYYYAELVPVTFHLKNMVDVKQGLVYLHDTFGTYSFYVVAVFVIALLAQSKLRGIPSALHVQERLVMLAMAAAVTLYVIKIGGDARHYRYLAFPFCLAACAFGGAVEVASARWPRALLPAVGLVLAGLFLWQHPKQLAHHPVFMIEGQEVADGIADAHHHRFHSELPRLRPWGGAGSRERLSDYRTYRSKVKNGEWPYRGVRHGYLCWQQYEAIDEIAVHDLGLTDPILARVDMRADRPGHKWGLRPLGSDLAKVRAFWGEKKPAPGMHRRAVEEGVAGSWIRDNLDSIELIERKAYNRHHFFENLALAFAFPDTIQVKTQEPTKSFTTETRRHGEELETRRSDRF